MVHQSPKEVATMVKLDEKLEGIYQDVLKRNPGEVEFH